MSEWESVYIVVAHLTTWYLKKKCENGFNFETKVYSSVPNWQIVEQNGKFNVKTFQEITTSSSKLFIGTS